MKKSLDINLKIKLKNKVVSQVKRGCSEFSLKFPEYANINVNDNEFMDYPIKWKTKKLTGPKKLIRQQENILIYRWVLSR